MEYYKTGNMIEYYKIRQILMEYYKVGDTDGILQRN